MCVCVCYQWCTTDSLLPLLSFFYICTLHLVYKRLLRRRLFIVSFLYLSFWLIFLLTFSFSYSFSFHFLILFLLSTHKAPKLISRTKQIFNAELTPWSKVLEKLIVTQLTKKFLAFYGTRNFVTVFTTARHWSLS
jgi:hypothetical protein